MFILWLITTAAIAAATFVAGITFGIPLGAAMTSKEIRQ